MDTANFKKVKNTYPNPPKPPIFLAYSRSNGLCMSYLKSPFFREWMFERTKKVLENSLKTYLKVLEKSLKKVCHDLWEPWILSTVMFNKQSNRKWFNLTCFFVSVPQRCTNLVYSITISTSITLRKMYISLTLIQFMLENFFEFSLYILEDLEHALEYTQPARIVLLNTKIIYADQSWV